MRRDVAIQAFPPVSIPFQTYSISYEESLKAKNRNLTGNTGDWTRHNDGLSAGLAGTITQGGAPESS
jgi:hypothetical protein